MTLSIIATAIGKGQRVMLRESCLAQAMRVSTAVPGLLAPLTVEGQRMVDGGLADNVPIREARERCNADVVIAINVGSLLLPPEQASGIFIVAAQMVALLAEQNVSALRATLKPGDIYIQPARLRQSTAAKALTLPIKSATWLPGRGNSCNGTFGRVLTGFQELTHTRTVVVCLSNSPTPAHAAMSNS